MFRFKKILLSISFFCLVTGFELQSAKDPEDMSQDELKRYFIEHYLHQKPSKEAVAQLDRLLKTKLEPLIEYQIEKYGRDRNMVRGYALSHEKTWACDGRGVIYVPLEFIKSAIIGGKTNTPEFWGNIGALHHEITHIEKRHAKKKSQYRAKKKRHNSWFLGGLSIQQDSSFFKNQEWEADEGVPDDRRMLHGLARMFYQYAKNEDITGNFTHPDSALRAHRFKERLKILLKKRNRNVNAFFGIDNKKVYPNIPVSMYPKIPVSVPKITGLHSECYQLAFDIIGGASPSECSVNMAPQQPTSQPVRSTCHAQKRTPREA